MTSAPSTMESADLQCLRNEINQLSTSIKSIASELAVITKNKQLSSLPSLAISMSE